MIVVYGASDDLIEIDGKIREELTYLDTDGADGQGDLLAFSTGHVVRVKYDDDGVWRLRLMQGRDEEVAFHKAVDDDGRREDAIAGIRDLSTPWLVHGVRLVK